MIFYTDECEDKIGYAFNDKSLLRICFTHTSYANEHNEQSNERLEFLGDSILNFTVASYLFSNNKDDEGVLTRQRAEIVSTVPIANAVKNLNLQNYLLLGEGEKNKSVNTNMCADLFEAVVGGIYLDGGLENAKKFIYNNLLKCNNTQKEADYKSKLQELVQKNHLGKIEYVQLDKTGPDHAPEYICGVKIAGKLFAKDKGQNKKQAEQRAAKTAFSEVSKLKTCKRGKQN